VAAGKVDLHVEQGATLTKRFIKKRNGVPDDLTGYTAKMQIRPEYGSDDILITLTSDAGTSNITLGGTAGTIVIRIGADKTSDFEVPADGGKLGVYDLALIDPNDATEVVRILRGVVFIEPFVTEI
jgi:hypothetical protein